MLLAPMLAARTGSLAAQGRQDSCPDIDAPFRGDVLRGGVIYRPGYGPNSAGRDTLQANAIPALRHALAHCDLWKVRRRYFGQTYTPNLVDWIVYLPMSGDSVREALTRDNRDLDPLRSVVRGARQVNAIIFVERPAGRGVRPAAESVLVRRDVLQEERDPFILRLLSGFGSHLLNSGEVTEDAAALEDTTAKLQLQYLGDFDHGGTPAELWVAFGKFRVSDDAWARMNLVLPEPEPGIPASERVGSVVRNFTTAGRSPFGLSIAAGLTPNGKLRSLKVDTTGTSNRKRFVSERNGHSLRFNGYLLAHFRFVDRRPYPLAHGDSLVWVRSVSLVAGTNLVANDPFTELVLGVSLDEIWGGPVGIVGGVAFLPEDEKSHDSLGEPTVGTHRARRGFIGVTLHL